MSAADDRTIVRHEEEASIETHDVDAGTVRLRKHVETEAYAEVVPRSVEHGEIERAPVGENDSGEIETLPDGSISVPLFEEEIVITKRTVVRERVIVRKHTVTEEHTVEAELRRERMEVDAEDGAILDGD